MTVSLEVPAELNDGTFVIYRVVLFSNGRLTRSCKKGRNTGSKVAPPNLLRTVLSEETERKPSCPGWGNINK